MISIKKQKKKCFLNVFFKRRKELLGNMVGSRAGPGKTQLSLGHLVVTESKKVIFFFLKAHQKDKGDNLKELPVAKAGILSNKIMLVL